MKLTDMVNAYIDYKRSRGLRFRSDVKELRSYCRAMGDIAVEEVSPDSVLAFIAGSGAVTARWVQKYRILGRLYRLHRPARCPAQPRMQSLRAVGPTQSVVWSRRPDRQECPHDGHVPDHQSIPWEHTAARR